nr:dihydrodipicolinate synthase family protein [Deinococcota bacterium]
MPATLILPTPDGGTAPRTLTAGPTPSRGEAFDRTAFAAAHIVADPLADTDPWVDAAIDWDRTLAYRAHLWSLGLGVAEAMDTAQR